MFNNSTKNLWSDELVARLRELWPVRSASEIVSMLFVEFGAQFTRNAIVGKAHRLGCEAKVSVKLGGGTPKGSPKPRSNGTKVIKTVYDVVWTSDLDAYIARLHRENGMRPAQINSCVQSMFKLNITPRAIFARLALLGIKPNAAPSDRVFENGRAVAASPNQLYQDWIAEPGVSLADHVALTCHWPVNAEGESAMLCGAKLFHRSYCLAHTIRGFKDFPAVPTPMTFACS